MSKNKYNYSHKTRCLDCKKIITNSSSRCRACADKEHSKRMLKEGNSNFKHGHCCNNECIDCKKSIRKYHLRCWKCYCKWVKISEHASRFQHYHSIKSRQKISQTRINRKIAKGKRNPMFHNWISRKSYSINWSAELKESIRKRDNYTCQNCEQTQRQELQDRNRRLSIHHIDYDKENCKENNLITLCQECHIKTNGNRDYWYAYFTYLIDNEKDNT